MGREEGEKNKEKQGGCEYKPVYKVEKGCAYERETLLKWNICMSLRRYSYDFSSHKHDSRWWLKTWNFALFYKDIQFTDYVIVYYMLLCFTYFNSSNTDYSHWNNNGYLFSFSLNVCLHDKGFHWSIFIHIYNVRWSYSSIVTLSCVPSAPTDSCPLPSSSPFCSHVLFTGGPVSLIRVASGVWWGAI